MRYAEGLWRMRRHGPVIAYCTDSEDFPLSTATPTDNNRNRNLAKSTKERTDFYSMNDNNNKNKASPVYSEMLYMYCFGMLYMG